MIMAILASGTAFINFLYLIGLAVWMLSLIKDELTKYALLYIPFFVLGIILTLAVLMCGIVSAVMICVNSEGGNGVEVAEVTITLGIVNDFLIAFVPGYFEVARRTSIGVSLIHLIFIVAGLIAVCLFRHRKLE